MHHLHWKVSVDNNRIIDARNYTSEFFLVCGKENALLVVEKVKVVQQTAPSFIFWWSKLEILFVPLHCSFYFTGAIEQRSCRPFLK
jgi:hypothetical protein